MIKLLFTHVMYFIFIISSLDHVCKGYKQEQDSSKPVFWWLRGILVGPRNILPCDL